MADNDRFSRDAEQARTTAEILVARSGGSGISEATSNTMAMAAELLLRAAKIYDLMDDIRGELVKAEPKQPAGNLFWLAGETLTIN